MRHLLATIIFPRFQTQVWELHNEPLLLCFAWNTDESGTLRCFLRSSICGRLSSGGAFTTLVELYKVMNKCQYFFNHSAIKSAFYFDYEIVNE